MLAGDAEPDSTQFGSLVVTKVRTPRIRRIAHPDVDRDALGLPGEGHGVCSGRRQTCRTRRFRTTDAMLVRTAALTAEAIDALRPKGGRSPIRMAPRPSPASARCAPERSRSGDEATSHCFRQVVWSVFVPRRSLPTVRITGLIPAQFNPRRQSLSEALMRMMIARWDEHATLMPTVSTTRGLFDYPG